VLREYNNNKSNETINYLYTLIQILYFNDKTTPLPTIQTTIDILQTQTIPNIMKIFKIIKIDLQRSDTVPKITRDLKDIYIEPITYEDKNLLITLVCSITDKISCANIRVPKIFLENYILVSYINTDNKNVIMNDAEFVEIPMTSKKSITLNYQHMMFPPTNLNPGINIQSKVVLNTRKKGGNKTIRKYRKHNRNKTTRNYK